MNREPQESKETEKDELVLFQGVRRMIVFMPLQKNVPDPRNDWKPTVCPKCGRRCWLDLEGYNEVKRIYADQPISIRCTECALKEK